MITMALLVAGSAPAAFLEAADEPGRTLAAAKDERVNINTATEAELTKLKGIGRTVARRIVEYRETHGEFKKPEDVRKVEGVGKRVWEQNRDRIAVK
jgi:competence protein ComEA